MSKNIKQIRRQRRKKHFISFLLVIIVSAVLIACFAINNQSKTKDNAWQAPKTAEYYSENLGNSFNSNIDNSNDERDWCLVLVNKWNTISVDNKIETTELSNGERIDTRVHPYLQKMFDAARKSGVYPIVASGYRTAEQQQKIYDDKVEEYKAEGLSTLEAEKETEYWVAIPGTSEHQLGLAVDINADGIRSKGSEVYEWLQKNAHLYGFINRYPADKVDITGVAYEPWHYRYVGVEAATEIYNQGICLEEYLSESN